ncbi:MBL fold metallo-hydrolase [Chloroflexota bacterium]
MVDIKEVAENIYMIDNRLLSLPKWGSAYLINEEKKALIDAGPATSVNTVLSGIKDIGVRPEDIDYIIVTHIHLDHAGSAGVLIRDMPQAQVVVHHRGAWHLANPEKLINSAVEAQGEEVMLGYGEVVPVEEHKVRPVYDGSEIKLSEKQVLKFIDAPGHAPHELCIYESRNEGLFTGDAAGIYLAEGEILLPATVPPNFDLELCIDTLERLMKLKANLIYFSHFGVSGKAQEILQSVVDKLQAWDGIVTQAVKENRFTSAAERLTAKACAELEPIRQMESLYEYLTNFDIPKSVSGYIKYYKEKHQAELS